MQALGPRVLKHPERGDEFEVILFHFTLGLFWHLICVFLFSRVFAFFSHFSCGILIFQFVGLFLGFCFFTHFSGGILIFQWDAHISRFFRHGAKRPGDQILKCPTPLCLVESLNLKSALECCLDERLPLNSVGIRVAKRDVLRLVPRVSHGILVSTYFCYTPLCKTDSYYSGLGKCLDLPKCQGTVEQWDSCPPSFFGKPCWLHSIPLRLPDVPLHFPSVQSLFPHNP